MNYARLLLRARRGILFCLAAALSAGSFAADKVTMLTSWYAQAEHGGFYQALATGIYRKYGLDVTIRMGGPQVNGMQLLASGQADFLMGYDLQVLKSVEQGLPVTTVAASFQTDLQGMMTHPDVKSLGGLKNGKTVLVSTSGRTTWWPWLKEKYGLSDAQARPYTFNLQPFIADPNVAQQAYPSSELFQAEKAGEPAPQAKTWQALAAVALLAGGYVLALQPINTTEEFVRNIGLALVGIMIGTWLLFRSTVAAALSFYRKNKKRYYRGMNLIGASNLLFRIRGNVRTFTLIALLSGVTLGAFSMTYVQYYYSEKSAEINSPFSYEYVASDPSFDEKASRLIEDDHDHPVLAQLRIPVIEVKSELTNALELPIQYFSYAKPGTSISFLSADSYNRMSKALGREETVQLKGNEAASVRPMLDDQTESQYEGLSLRVKLEGGERTLPFVDMLKGRVSSWHFPDFVIVVSDSLFGEMAQQWTPTSFHVYRVADAKTAQATSERLNEWRTDDNRVDTFYLQYKNSLEEKGLFLFIVGFLGLVFLAATGSIIYFKQLTEAQADRGRYETLRKIGVSRSEIRGSIARQTLLAFALPLALGIAHGYVMLRIFTSTLVDMNLTSPILISMGAYVAVYFVYYILCVRTGNRLANGA